MVRASNELNLALEEFVCVFRPNLADSEISQFVHRIADGFVPERPSVVDAVEARDAKNEASVDAELEHGIRRRW